MAAILAPSPVARLSVLLAASCLGTGAALLGGRALLERLPPLTPALSDGALERARRWSPDPARRREAALLLEARSPGDAHRRRLLLRSRGWGPDPLAAVVLKQDALAAEALGRSERAEELWRDLLRRFPREPAAADALYSLGRRQPALREQLRTRFPSHPAALAAALEAGPAPAERLRGALHLARWGPRWPGAQERFQNLCRPGSPGVDAAGRARLAEGLALVGNGEAALACLGGGSASALSPAARLALAKDLLGAAPEARPRAEALLLALAAGDPAAPESGEAVRLLARQEGPGAAAALAGLPARWREGAPVAAHRALEALAPGGTGAGDPGPALAVLRRWPDDPASRELQWEAVRRMVLAGRWGEAGTLLAALDPDAMPPPLAARHRFWQGFVQRQLGQDEAAIASWRLLRLHHPGGYYGWRAAVQLGEGDLRLAPGVHGVGPAAAERESWRPLGSGDGSLDRLWRLDQRTEAWESWRHRRGGRPPEGAPALLVEGRLRQGVGDDWTGFDQLERATLALTPAQCGLLPQLERSLHPPRFPTVFRAAAVRERLPIELLLGVAKQESRFTPTVHSAAGAVGLMQVLPSTASEVAGKPVGAAALEDPATNVELGSRYLRGLLKHWRGDPLLAVASYNAGPGAVEGWRSPLRRSAPELWVESIPYPETRLYVKKVLGNTWSYQEERQPAC